MGRRLATTTSQQAWSSFSALFPAFITLENKTMATFVQSVLSYFTVPQVKNKQVIVYVYKTYDFHDLKMTADSDFSYIGHCLAASL